MNKIHISLIAIFAYASICAAQDSDTLPEALGGAIKQYQSIVQSEDQEALLNIINPESPHKADYFKSMQQMFNDTDTEIRKLDVSKYVPDGNFTYVRISQKCSISSAEMTEPMVLDMNILLVFKKHNDQWKIWNTTYLDACETKK